MISAVDTMSTIRHDIVIIGGGVAGLRAALAARDAGAEVGLLSKVHPIRSASVGAQGGMAAAMNNVQDGDEWKAHYEDTLHSGAGLCDADAVEVLCREGPDAVRELDAAGVLFDRFDDGSVAQRPYGGHSKARCCYSGDKTGHSIVHALYWQCVKKGVHIYPEWYVWELIEEKGTVCGCVALEIRDASVHLVQARAVVLATGGIGQLFSVTSNPFASTGDGIGLARAVGARLRDLEMVQFHPTGLYPRGILITEACRGEGGYLINAENKRFMFDYDPRGDLATRDIVSRGIQTEIDAGRGIQGLPCVGLDVRHLGREEIMKKIPQAAQIAREFANIDLATQILPVSPTAHYFMGGIAISLNGEVYQEGSSQQVIPGLFAAGECSCLSVHGANRLGCNSLLDGAVFGKRAGVSAAAFARGSDQISVPDVRTSIVSEEMHRWTRGTRLDISSGQLRARLQQGMTARTGVFREDQGLRKQQVEIQEIRNQMNSIKYLPRKGRAHQAIERKELLHSLVIAHMMVEGARKRTKSVGAHWRIDS